MRSNIVKITFFVLSLPIGLFVSFLLIFFGLPIMLFGTKENVDEYKFYRCYDVKLVALELDKELGRSERIDDCWYLRYNTIVDHDVNMFIDGEEIYGIHVTNKHYIYQNPSQYVSIRNDWKIREIEVTGNRFTRVLNRNNTNSEQIQQFQSLLGSDVLGENPLEFPDEVPGGSLSLRISFYESQNIVLDTVVVVLETDDGGCSYLDIGTDLMQETGRYPRPASYWVPVEGELNDLFVSLYEDIGEME